MAFVGASGTFENQGVLTEFIAEYVDYRVGGHRQFWTGSREGVHPVPARG